MDIPRSCASNARTSYVTAAGCWMLSSDPARLATTAGALFAWSKPMSGAWERRRILIWGKTRPELSRNYRETVCTGGVFEDSGRLVRLYPIPLRYLDDEKYFKKYQW